MTISRPRPEARVLTKGLGDSPIADEMFKALQYYWNAARGYRFNPWKSPYIRWRFETFLGKEAANLTARKFFRLAWKYRDQMERFVDWAAERQLFQRRHHAGDHAHILNYNL
jgi:hypothetical protein